MQNKAALWIFTGLLALACLYELSFTLVTSNVEDEAKVVAENKLDSVRNLNTEMTTLEEDSTFQRFESEYLLAQNSVEVYPLIGYTYRECKQRELSKGLDLQGGMNVTLEVSVVDLIRAMAANSENEVFNQAIENAKIAQQNATEDFTTLFGNEVTNLDPNFKLASVFHNRENKELFPKDASNDEVLNIIRNEASDAVKRTEQVLRKRIDGLGVVQPKIQRLATSDRIIVELPGIKDKSRARKVLTGTAKLEFWETYDNREVFGFMEQANTYMRELNKAGAGQEEASIFDVDSNDVDTPEADGVEGSLESTVEEVSLTTDSADAEDEGSLLDDLAAEQDDADSGANAVEEPGSQTFEEFAQENPFFGVFQPNLFGEGGQIAPGPVVAVVNIKNKQKAEDILNDPKIMKSFPDNLRLLWDAKPILDRESNQPTDFYNVYAIRISERDGKARLEGDAITNATVQADPNGQPYISMTMNATGAKEWRDMTREASQSTLAGSNEPLKRSIAVVLDDLVYTAPTVNGEIPGGQSSIEGQFSPEEAEDLANVLKAGKLPAPANIIEEAVVGPSLGQEAIEDGILSFVIAFLLILVYMVFYYARAGAVADLALIANIFFVFGVLTAINATLTLPGIAGIVLTIGMSVDANVLIYERIREEVRAGKGMKLAISDGYNNAYSSILDANVTTLLTGIILLVFGSGPIKGFATTLIIGILTSLFSAIFITRLIFEWMMTRKDEISFSTKLTENLFRNMNFSFVKKRRMYYVVSGIIIGAGMLSLVVRGLNYGVDFTGGRTYLVRFENSAQVEDVADALQTVFIGADGVAQRPEVKTYGASNQVKVTTKYLINETDTSVASRVESTLKSGLNTLGDDFEIMSSNLVQPTIADDIKQSSFMAIGFALAVIFLYILLRFRKWQYGLGALTAVGHDVLVVLGIFSIFYGIAPWSMEIDQAFIAAILTVVGYSINDTVVVFDRIREYVGLHKGRPYKTNVNDALNSTLSRTVNTSMSTFLVLLMIFIFGGEVIRGFVFALMVGIIVGTYSSLCVATPTVIDFTKDDEKAK